MIPGAQQANSRLAIEQLEIGDIIFDVDYAGVPLHVSIYAGKKDGHHFVTHAVTSKYNSVMMTRLQPDHYPRRIFRCKDATLALNVALRMGRWAYFQIPFSERKHNRHLTILDVPGFSHPVTGPEAQCEYAESQFSENFYRYIAYASHPDLPFYPHQNMDGFYCSEAIVAAFQVETLLMVNAVKPQGNVWVADKNDGISMAHEPEGYRRYVASMPVEIMPSQMETAPSYQAWQSDLFSEDIQSFAQTSACFLLKLDSEVAGRAAMFAYFLKHEESWTDCGTMDVEPMDKIPFEDDANQKDKWRNYTSLLFSSASSRRSTILKVSLGATHPPEEERAMPRSLSLPDLSLLYISEAETLEERAARARVAQLNKWASPTKPHASPLTIQRLADEPTPIRRKLFS